MSEVENAPPGDKIQVEVVQDQPEGVVEPKPQQKQELSDGVQKRINQLTRKFKEEKEARLRERQAYEERIARAEQAIQSAATQSRQATEANYGALEKQLKDKVELAKSSLKVAHETGDTAKVVEASLAMADAQSELKLLAYTRPQAQAQQDTQQRQQTQVRQAQPQPVYDPKAVAWAEDKPWFGKDRVLTAGAFAINEDLIQEGFDPQDEGFYEELDTRLTKEFPAKFKKEAEPVEQRKSAQSSPVAAVSRTPDGKIKVKMTKGMERAARTFGLTTEQYAAQLAAVEAAGDDYVTINVARGGK